MSDQPGRSCPLRYRYGAAALAAAPVCETATLYVIGGVYGNLLALDAVDRLAAAEAVAPRLCFNGDFNWFNVDPAGFAAVNARVLEHDAITGNVEAELGSADGDAGCGCAYPDHVDAAVVERSNRIHARLRETAATRPDLVARLAALPMFARYRVGACRIGVVHGDADSLAGWGFDATALDDPAGEAWRSEAFERAQVDVFASSHTCAPALRRFEHAARVSAVINNGAAGMPNFRASRAGLITRISLHASPHPPSYGIVVQGVHVDALELPYDHAAWVAAFSANWPPGSDAWLSYRARICGDAPACDETAQPA